MKKISAIHIIAALMAMVVFSQCYYDQVLEPIAPAPDKELSFTADIQPIFDASCNGSGCHNTGGTAPDLTAGKAYNALINGNYINTGDPESSELYQWMKGNKGLPMPVSGSNATYNATVLEWINQGAKNN
jgi:hypothetical protein